MEVNIGDIYTNEDTQNVKSNLNFLRICNNLNLPGDVILYDIIKMMKAKKKVKQRT